MRLATLAPILILAGCASVPPPSPSAIAGTWRSASGMNLSISRFSSFAVRHGCIVTGGMLHPLGSGRYRIEHYATGFATDRCGPWRSGPEIAPFDGAEVTLSRSRDGLTASGGSKRVTLRWQGPGTV